MYELLKCYRRDYCNEKTTNVKDGTYKHSILKKPVNENFKPIFVELEKKREARYFPHPFKNWGPKGRAKEIKVCEKIVNNLIKW